MGNSVTIVGAAGLLVLTTRLVGRIPSASAAERKITSRADSVSIPTR